MNRNYIITTLKQRPELLPQVIALIESGFDYDNNYSYAVDFMLLMNKNNHQNCHIIVNNNNEVLAHLAVSLRNIGTDTFNIPVALIGGAVTHPLFRGRGFFRLLMERILQQQTSKVAIFLLWSSVSGLYKKFGFYPAGGQLSINLPVNPSSIHYTRTSFIKLSDNEKNEIIALHRASLKNNLMITRTLDEWNTIFKIDSIDVYIKKSDGEIDSYYCIGKGCDLKNIIHEFGPLDKSANKLIEHISYGEMWLPSQYVSKFPKATVDYSALIKTGCLELFNKLIEYLTEQQIYITEISDEILKAEFQNKNFTLKTHDFLTHLFGPYSINDLPRPVYPFYITGTDSI